MFPSTDENGTNCAVRTIQDGDLVVVYEGPERVKAVHVSRKEQFQNRFGVFKHADWIGVPFGSKVFGKQGNGRGFVHLLAPNPQLWTQVLPHRTQILYLADISLIVSWLELRPGSIVLESGTGSGSLSTSLATAVGPTGHVFTFEYHQLRADTAREEFRKNGLEKLVTVTVRDIQGEGFPVELAGRADAIFLDLPGPWLAVPSASRSLRPDGPFCSFSPCIEQVQKTCEALRENGFTDIRTMEILARQYEIRQEQLITNLGDENLMEFGKPPPPKRFRENQEGKFESKMSTNKSSNEEEIKIEVGVSFEVQSNHQNQLKNEDSEPAPSTEKSRSSVKEEERLGETEKEKEKGKVKGREEEKETGKEEEAGKVQVVARPVSITRGHTGYLSFARKFV